MRSVGSAGWGFRTQAIQTCWLGHLALIVWESLPQKFWIIELVKMFNIAKIKSAIEKSAMKMVGGRGERNQEMVEKGRDKQRKVRDLKYYCTFSSFHIFDRQSFDRHCFDRHYFDRHFFNRHCFNRHCFDRHCFDRHCFDRQSFDRHCFDRQSFDRHCFDRHCFDRHCFDSQYFDYYFLSGSRYQAFEPTGIWTSERGR